MGRVVFFVLLLLGLGACGGSDTGDTTASADATNWRLASGKSPSHDEFAAVVAACQDRAGAQGGGSIDPCLTDLGLHRLH